MFRGRIVHNVAISIALAFLLWCHGAALADNGPESKSAAPGEAERVWGLGETIAQERVDAIIARLNSESLEDSLENLDYVDDWRYPGCSSGVPVKAPFGRPFEAVEQILSNRRFAKLYEQLRALDRDTRYAHLTVYLARYVSHYQELVEGCKLVNMPPGPRVYDLGRLTEVEGKPPTFTGTRLAVQSVVLLSGLLGEARVLPAIKELVACPVTGGEFVESDFDAHVVERLTKYEPLMPEAISAQAIFLMARNADASEASALGVHVEEAISLVEDAQQKIDEEYSQRPLGPFQDKAYKDKCALRTIGLASFQSRVTVYDVHHQMSNVPLDKSHGTFEIEFMTTPDWKLIEQVKECLSD